MTGDNIYINRELSWLNFNLRVLEQATASEVPLFERLRFIGIFSNNLDEFFMVRVGGLRDRSLIPDSPPDSKTGMTASEQLDLIYRATRALYVCRDRIFTEMEEKLARAGIRRLDLHAADPSTLAPVKKYFRHELLPLLSPYVIDPKHPLPHLENRRMYIAASLKRDGRSYYGIVPVSDALGTVYIRRTGDGIEYAPVEDILLRFASQIFSKYTVSSRCIVRITRNADVEVDDNFSDENVDMDSVDYREYVRVIIKNRAKLSPVRLDHRGGGYAKSRKPVKYIAQRLKIEDDMCFESLTPLDGAFIRKLERHARPDMLYTPRPPKLPRSLEGDSRPISEIARERDILLVYPYERMDPYLQLLREAADDPHTVSIKITLYRLSAESQVVATLCRAAENGREVTAVVELKARFDENNNISWSKRLEESGVHVVYGIGGLKVHSKITLITRRREGRTESIAHIGTGNYNESTARQYVDYGIITSDSEICADAAEFFRCITLGITQTECRRLWIAPETLKPSVLSKIKEQAELADKGLPAYICMKMNGLTDKDIIDALADASRRGVSVDLIVRGICCLRPGVPDRTENIRVVSIVGRYLEHGRIYIFGAGDPNAPDELGDREVYIGSADLMTRNTTRRVEICTPVLDRKIAARLFKITREQLRDNVKSRWLFSSGRYERPITDKPPFDSQIMGEN